MAFTFLNAVLLAAATAAVIPLIIHLLRRRKAREDFLPTLRFLQAGVAANRRRTRLTRLLVLFLRMLALLLLAAAFARPAYTGAFFSRRGTASVSAVMVLDNSVSMAYEHDGIRRFNRAKDRLKEAIAGLPAGSRTGLVVTGLGPRGESLDRGFAFESGAIADAIDSLDISAYGGDCVGALRRAYAMLEEPAGDTPSGREVYAASDLAAHAWNAAQRLTIPSGVQTVILDAGSDADVNYSIDSAQAEWHGGNSSGVTVSTTVAAGSAGGDRLMEISIAGAKRAEHIINLAPHARITQAFDVPILEPGGSSLQGRVTLANDDPIRADNTRYFTAPRTRSISCLVIRAPAKPPARDPAFFVGNALEPRGLSGATGVSVRYADDAAVTRETLDSADVAILAGVPAPPESLWKLLDEFAAAGKGLVVFTAQDVNASSYAAFLRARFGVELSDAASAGEGTFHRLEIPSFGEAIVAAFAAGKNGDLSAARVFKWRRMRAVAGAAQSRVLARIEGGDAAVVAAPEGGPRAVLVTFAPTPDETDLVLRTPFVPFVNETVRYAAGARVAATEEAVDVEAGAAVTLPVARHADAAKAELITPLEQTPEKVALAPGATAFTYRPFFPGNYVARLPGANGAQEFGFSVNTPASESVLARASRVDLETIAPGAIVARGLSGRAVERAWGRTRGARELFDLFIVAAVIVLVAEEFAANRTYKEPAEGGR